MYYIIQENVFRESHYNRIIDVIIRLGLKYEIVKVLGNSEDIQYQTDRKDVFCFGAIKLARLANNLNWQPGSLMNENHDYNVYSKHWKNNLLNYDSVIQKSDEPISFNGLKKFIRPTKDSKIFTGQLFNELEWTELLENRLLKNTAPNSLIQIAHPKTIQQEIRCWVVNHKVISASTYKIGESVIYREFTDNDGLSFSQKMVDIYQPADTFVIDICLVEHEWKIVEINCINSAGFYACDLQKVVIALEEYYG